MDNLNYVSKKLVAEYREKEQTDFKVVETAYMQGNDNYIIEYDGGKHSLYAVVKTFFSCQARSGSYTMNKSDYEIWKKIRKECDENNEGIFTCFELNQQELLELDLKDYINKDSIDEDKNIKESLKDSDLPF